MVAHCVGAGITCQPASQRAPARLAVLAPHADGAGWQLVALTESSAESKLQQLLEAEQWEAAALLAETHNLDADLVRK